MTGWPDGTCHQAGVATASSTFNYRWDKLQADNAYLKTFNQHFLCMLQWYIAVNIYDGSSIEDIKSDLRDLLDKGHFLHITVFEATRALTRPKAPELPQDEIEEEITERIEKNRGMAAVMQRHLEKYPPEFTTHPEIKYVLPRLLLYKMIVGIVEAGHTDFTSPEVYARAQENIERISSWINCCSLIEIHLTVPMGAEV